MEIWSWVLSGILILIVFILLIKLFLMRKSVKEIETGLAEHLRIETNTLIDVSSRDPSIRSLAESLNQELRVLRRERHRFQQGDLELKDTLTNISHDLRTPLTAICGYLDLLEKEEKSDTAKRYLNMIANRTEVLKQLTEELFRYSIISSEKELSKEKVELNRVLEESLVSFYGAMRQKSILPRISIPQKSVERELDSSALNRIFSNIISNALKYSDGDFEVRMDEKGTIFFANTAKDLSPVAVGRLFDRFYTVETGMNSTGLGLSIAKRLTERMGGFISADYRDSKLFITLFFPQPAGS